MSLMVILAIVFIGSAIVMFNIYCIGRTDELFSQRISTTFKKELVLQEFIRGKLRVFTYINITIVLIILGYILLFRRGLLIDIITVTVISGLAGVSYINFKGVLNAITRYNNKQYNNDRSRATEEIKNICQ